MSTSLNPEQQKAVDHHLGPILILAGAGTGKTRVLTNRVANLVNRHGVSPDRILAVTFTNKATNEMRERLENLLGPQSKQLWISTFHSMSLRILRRHAPLLGYKTGFVIYDTNDGQSLMKQILKKLGLNNNKVTPSYYLNVIDSLKNKFIGPEEFQPDYADKKNNVADVYDAYQKALMQNNAMDFSDLIFNCLKLLNNHPDVRRLYQNQLQFILVDEFQDTNKIQYDIIQHLAQPKNNLLVVGDDDQSIYAFRGADITNILSFEKDYPNTVTIKLEQNYRSTKNILDAAHGIISKNMHRKAKKLWTDSNDGALIEFKSFYNESEEANFVVRQIEDLMTEGRSFKDYAVFYRTNAQSRALEEAFLRAKIPFKIFGGFKFYERKEVKDILAYLRLIHNPSDTQALIRIINVPRRGIGAQTLQNIIDQAEIQGLSAWEYLLKADITNRKLLDFVIMLKSWQDRKDQITVAENVRDILEKTKYLELNLTDDDKDQDRKENIAELVAVAEGFSAKEDSLAEFLDHVALMTAVDQSNGNVEDNEANFVSLMTLHMAKGLEFPVVFFTGLEEGLVPHSRSIDENSIDEERRLCYVGITRAREQLFLTYAQQRSMASAMSSFGYGGYYRAPSRFVEDIPVEVISGNEIGETKYDFEIDPIDEDYITSFNMRNKKPKNDLKEKVFKRSGLNGIVQIADKLKE